MNRKRPRLWLALLLLGLGIGVGVLCVSPPAPAVAQVQVRFVGYTNDASGTRMAAFDLSNSGERPVKRWATYRCSTNSDGLHGQPFVSMSYISLIQTGGSERILVPPPPGPPWRVTFTYSADGSWPRLYVWLVNAGVPRWAARVANRVRVEQVDSAWIDP